ncbi:Phosphatase yihX [Bacteroidales bacterium Barb6]|nr:Phosphatase yihX [Bacteroidales bacterium Barb6]
MAVKNIMFDLGGVLVTLDLHRFIECFKEKGMPDVGDLIDPYEQKGFLQELETGKIDRESFRRKLSEYAGRELSDEDTTYILTGFTQDVPQYKLDYITELRKTYNVYVLSNTNPIVMDWFESDAFSPAGRPLSDYCEKVYTSFEIGVAKPDPDIFYYVEADARILPWETLFVDDGARNIETAAALGWHTLLVQNGEDWRNAVNETLRSLTQS